MPKRVYAPKLHTFYVNSQDEEISLDELNSGDIVEKRGNTQDDIRQYIVQQNHTGSKYLKLIPIEGDGEDEDNDNPSGGQKSKSRKSRRRVYCLDNFLLTFCILCFLLSCFFACSTDFSSHGLSYQGVVPVISTSL